MALQCTVAARRCFVPEADIRNREQSDTPPSPVASALSSVPDAILGRTTYLMPQSGLWRGPL